MKTTVYLANLPLTLDRDRNIGSWVGQPFREALREKSGREKVSFQGVSPRDYPADLDGYIEDGGPESCAISLGSAVERYADRCPASKIVIAGWRYVDVLDLTTAAS